MTRSTLATNHAADIISQIADYAAAQKRISASGIRALTGLSVAQAGRYVARMVKDGLLIRVQPRKRAGRGWTEAVLAPGACKIAGGIERRVGPARQVGMGRHWMDVALFGEARA